MCVSSEGTGFVYVSLGAPPSGGGGSGGASLELKMELLAGTKKFAPKIVVEIFFVILL
jgi:hypothetical protein